MNWKGFSRELCGRVEVLSQYLPEGIEENHGTVSRDSLCPGRDSNRVPPEYKPVTLLLGQSVRFYLFHKWKFKRIFYLKLVSHTKRMRATRDIYRKTQKSQLHMRPSRLNIRQGTRVCAYVSYLSHFHLHVNLRPYVSKNCLYFTCRIKED
jgi:hypothetical protein